MSDIKVDMDISSVVQKTAEMLKLNKQQEDSLKKLVATTINLTNEGKAAVVYTNAQISANQNLITVLQKEEDGWKKLSEKVTATTAAQRRQREEVQRLLSSDNLAKLDKIAKPTKIDFDTSSLQKIEKIDQ